MTIKELLLRYEPDLRAHPVPAADAPADEREAHEEVMRSLKRDARAIPCDENELETLETLANHRPAAWGAMLATLAIEWSKHDDGS